jgi:hypothetical protein
MAECDNTQQFNNLREKDFAFILNHGVFMKELIKFGLGERVFQESTGHHSDGRFVSKMLDHGSKHATLFGLHTPQKECS